MEREALEAFVHYVEELGFTGLPLARYYEQMQAHRLSELEVKNYLKWFGKDRASFDLAFEAVENHPCLSGYTATIRQVPPVEHGIYSGIDTAALEQKMGKVNWNRKGEHDPADKSTQAVLKTIPDIFLDLGRLSESGDSKAVLLADSLKIKYWSGTLVEQSLDLTAIVQQFEKKHYFRIKGDELSDVTSRQAYNLLSGRHVLKFETAEAVPFSEYWIGLEPSGNGFSHECYDEFNIKEAIGRLQVAEMKNDQSGAGLIRSLIEGDLVAAHISAGEKLIPVLLAANAKKKEITLFNEQGVEFSPEQLLHTHSGQKNKKDISSRKPPLVKRKPGKNKGKSP